MTGQIDGARTPPAVLPFPQTTRVLDHYSSSMDTAGFLTLLLWDREGEPIPSNVQRIDEPGGPTFPSRGPAFLLAMLIWEGLPDERRERIKCLVRGMAYSEHPIPEAVQPHNALKIHAIGGSP